MYDQKRYTALYRPTVAEIISKLQLLPPNAQITICGDDNFHIHVEIDNSVVNLDNEDLDDCYAETIGGGTHV